MLTDLQSRLKRAGRWLPVALLPLLPFAAHAQFNYAPANAVNVAGTYTDLGTSGTAITTANTDDANSAAQPIGFTFNFNGTAFTQFVLNTNGLIRLGSAAPSTAAAFPAYAQAPETAPISGTNAADVNLISPFNLDLGPGSVGNTAYSVAVTGTAPNRVCTIQWKNVADKPQAAASTVTTVITTQLANFSFQVKLYETTNNIEFVYDAAVAGTGTANAKYAAVGIKGSAPASSVLATKGSSATWSTTTFLVGPYLDPTQANAHNVRQTFLPDAGRTYRFVPTVLLSNDAAVTALYTLGKVAPTYNSPTTAQAVITNTGSTAQTNLPVTLAVSGATTQTVTQTVATLAPGASTTLTFTYQVVATTGTNTVTVTIPADGLATNNTQTASQAISAADQSYIQGTTYTGGVGLQFAGNILAVRYTTTSASATISTVTPTFVGAAATGVTSTYQVLIYSAGATGQPGTVLYTSPVLTRPTIVGATTATAAPVSIPGIAVSGTFFVAVKTIGADNIGIAYQTESPLRAGTFFYTVDTGTTWNDLNTQTISPRIGLDMTFGTASTCPPVTALAVGSITNTTASVTFTAPAGATGYIVTYTPASGTATTVTPAPTASPVALTGLTAGVTYTVSVTNNCGTGNTSGAVTTTFTTTGGSTGLTNDEPSGAIILPLAATCTPVNGTNIGATTTGGTTPSGYSNPGCGIAVSPKDVWFKFTTAATSVGSTDVSVQVTGTTAGQVRVFSAATNAGPFTEIGCAAGTTNNTAAGPLRLTGLTANTTYYVFVSGYGSGDTQGPFTICAVGLAPPATPTYVTLPYTEGFEGPWVSVLSTNDVPTVNWRNTPIAGDNSWRRDDDGFTSAGWRFVADETGATPPYVIRSSVGLHSARFHTWAAAVGLQGKLDLYANLSGTGTKTLSFDYINPTGTDQLDVFVSTNGGITFGTTPVLTATTNAAFTNKTVTIAGNSATTVIRFQATSDFGDDDLGIDNLRLAVVTATQNAALAATVGLYPNPAHQSFQLNVPAGSLHNASATLSNALGQVVLKRQLNLPAAGGTADFNVSSLAAGVYSLTLKSGNDLVVKRVVVE